MTFENLNLIKPLQKALIEKGYAQPTPIQEKAIPSILNGNDVLGCAQTGTGKTAAFALPILQILYKAKFETKGKREVSTLILTPTRELALQIHENFTAYGKYTNLRNVVVFGGVPQKKQTDKLKSGADIIIATPGRLLDLINQNYISLQHIKLFVLDEADRMLDMGFIHDVKKIISKLPAKRQTLFFSATMPKEIKKLSDTILFKPVKIEVTPESSTVDTIQQSVYFVSKPDKKALLIHILKNQSIKSALVFTRTKHGANTVTRFLNKERIFAEAIHGNKSQSARQNALSNFKAKKTRVLVATDIAARGIDVEELSHVINYEIPNISETYVHRIGRTGRAGLSGTALSFCDPEERSYLKNISKLIDENIPVIEDHPFHMTNESGLTDIPVGNRLSKRINSGDRKSSEISEGKNKKRVYGKNNHKRKNYKYGRNKTRSN